MGSIIDELRAVGFSLYEAKIYVALLRHGAQNGNELSRNSGVPSSKVYSTVEKLISQGTVQSISSPAGTQYVGTAPDELVSRLRQRFNDPIDYLAQQLPPLVEFVPDEVFLNVGGDETILAASTQIIGGAVSHIYLSVWGPEISALRKPLSDASERGVKIFGMLYSEHEELPAGSWLRHGYETIVGNRIEGRMLTLVADRSEALIARFPTNGNAAGVRTRNPVLTLIVSEYLHHDIVLQRAQMNIGFDEWDSWWLADPELRTSIFGDAIERGAVHNDVEPEKRASRAKRLPASRGTKSKQR